MTIVRMISTFPAGGKVRNIRALLEPRAKERANTSLSIGIIGEMPTITETSLFDSLEEFEKERDANLADPNWGDFLGQVGSQTRKPSIIRLLSPIVMPVGQATVSGRYSQMAVFIPTYGGLDSVREILEEFAKQEQANGRSQFRMAQQLFSDSGTALTLGDSYESLAELENLNRERGERVTALRAKLAPNLSALPVQRIRETIVPFGD